MIPKHLLDLDLVKFRRVPQWVVEYKALVLLLRVVLLYQAAIYVVCTLMVFASVLPSFDYSQSQKSALVADCGGCNAFEWSLFTTVSAYCNVGVALSNNSLEPTRNYPFVEFWICAAILCGNVMFPIFIRWIIVGISVR